MIAALSSSSQSFIMNFSEIQGIKIFLIIKNTVNEVHFFKQSIRLKPRLKLI